MPDPHKSTSISFFNRTKNTMVAANTRVADSFFSRLQGLLGSSPLQPGAGLYLIPCNAIHMFFMTFAIDAIFLDKENTVVGLEENLQPWKLSASYKKARGCLELPPGTIASTNTKLGDKIETHP
jgi:uncharacterized membrane protein (UPF0127 family)